MNDLLPTLPLHLAERTRVLNDGHADGGFVLYWMHHAVRGHENPALDAAVAAGNALALPVLVYQGLSPRLPFASDRHHTFILEGIRDAEHELAERGIAHAFFLAPQRDDREPLPALAERAALVVTEDFPAPPYPRWTRALTDRMETPVWAVDACCIVPMQLPGRAYERAFQFRRRVSGELERRIHEPWRDIEPEAGPFGGDLGFEATELRGADVAELCARCEIDHAVGPVAHTRGGSTAGYERWRRFRDTGGLRYYARRRNDAARDGVSRLSPYLHHGHVSPFRVAREAAASGSDGARKFLDELLIWRVARPARSDAPTVAVIGAGISGLVAARTLRDHGLEVSVYDKARGAGGRLATRREGEHAFDHGAQYFTVRDRRFRRYVESWVEEGVAAPWRGRIAALEDGRVTPKEDDPERFVGVPGMSAVARHLASSLEVAFSTRVARVARRDGRWELACDDGRPLGAYDAVIVTAPPAQAAELLTGAPALAERARAVELLPCWAVMAVFDRELELGFDGAFVNDASSPLSWVARNSSKPGRPGSESWVLHASPEWSAIHLERDGGTVTESLVNAFFGAAATTPREPLLARAHRWRYAIAREPLDVGCLWDPELMIGACGDWCQGSRVEGAFLSGMAIAGRVLGTEGRRSESGQLGSIVSSRGTEPSS